MQRIFPLIFIFVCTLYLPARAADIVTIQSASLAAYSNALLGFETRLLRDIPDTGPKSIQAHSITSHVLSETKNPNRLRKQIIKEKPDLLVVIGSSSLSLVQKIRNIPIIYLLVPYPELSVKGQKNITGVRIRIPAEQQLQALLQAMPQIQRIGLLYDPARTSDFVEDLQEAAAQKNIQLTALVVNSAADVPEMLSRLGGNVDCFWMLPDRTVLSPRTVDYIFLYSLENGLPVFTFSKKYLDMGAVLSVSFDTHAMGKQAAKMAQKILHGIPVSDIPAQEVETILVHKNEAAAKILGVELEGEL